MTEKRACLTVSVVSSRVCPALQHFFPSVRVARYCRYKKVSYESLWSQETVSFASHWFITYYNPSPLDTTIRVCFVHEISACHHHPWKQNDDDFFFFFISAGWGGPGGPHRVAGRSADTGAWRHRSNRLLKFRAASERLAPRTVHDLKMMRKCLVIEQVK